MTMLAGCAALQPGADETLAVGSVVSEAVDASRVSAAQQRRVLADAQEALAREPGAVNRLRLATLLATLPAPLRDDARAAEMLAPLASTPSPAIGRFAALLGAQIAERQRLARDLERVAKDRERVERERERAERAGDEREKALRQQLEALRSIERGILEREERLRRNKR
ncbi:MAG: hypothetical protein A3D95_02455 [Betaproteobacteria bacterium RIFCSPHIGHO2_12_FULL_69_13]|nr:MAG: hypothetical protein A3D95_02455 [Betaproteobacteria bacterium RIFCSPHIGHO2_12_FULL_69_13]